MQALSLAHQTTCVKLTIHSHFQCQNYDQIMPIPWPISITGARQIGLTLSHHPHSQSHSGCNKRNITYMVYIELRKYGRQVFLSAGYKPIIHIPLSQDLRKKSIPYFPSYDVVFKLWRLCTTVLQKRLSVFFLQPSSCGYARHAYACLRLDTIDYVSCSALGNSLVLRKHSNCNSALSNYFDSTLMWH